VRWQRYRHLWWWLIGIILLVALVSAVGATWEQRVTKPNVVITIDHSSSVGQSHFAPGMTYIDNFLTYPFGNNDASAIANVKSLMGNALSYQNTSLTGWGLPDLWPDPSTSEPNNWAALDARLNVIEETGSTPVITLYGAPWWMKGQLQADGTARLLTKADEWIPRAFSSRILDNKMDAWLHLVQRVAERYMAPPYNVRYFQVWNEMKGYYNQAKNNYDYTTSAGNPSGPNARHGYTYMYNLVYARLMAVASSLGIPTNQIKVGGPYVVMDTWSTRTEQSDPSDLTRAYGTFDERPLDVVKYWLQHKSGAAFISVDAGNTNKDGVNYANASTAAGKLADIVHWIRSLDGAAYPGARDLPIWLGEWYARPYTDWSNNDHSNAIKTVAMMEFLKAGGAVALSWGGTDEERAGPRLWTTTTAGGGTVLPFYFSYRAFKDYFGPGADLYAATASPAGRVDVLASSDTVMLVNKTATTLLVSLTSDMVSLEPYQVTVLRL
jgi:hypothetical protein